MKKEKKSYNDNIFLKILIGFVTSVIITLLYPNYESVETDLNVGMIWGKEDLIASFTFPVYKSESVYKREIDEAKKNILPVYYVNSEKSGKNINWLDSLEHFFVEAKKIVDYENDYNKEKALPDEKRSTNIQTLKNKKESFSVYLGDLDWNLLNNIFNSSNPVSIENFKKKLIQSLNQIYGRKIIDTLNPDFSTKKISFIKNKNEETIDAEDFYDPSEVNNLLDISYKNYFKTNELSSLANRISKQFIYPDFKFNRAESEKVIAVAIESVSKTIGIVKENERIVSKHQPINEPIRLKLESYNKIRNEQMGSRDYYLQMLGRFLFVSTLLVLFGIFLFKLRTKTYIDNSKLILISSLLILESLFAYFSLNNELSYPIEFLIFVPVAVMLLTILFDSRLAFYAMVIICILVSALRGGDYDIFVPNFVASSLAIYSVRDIKNRMQIFTSMIYIFIGYAVTIFALNLERFESIFLVKNQLLVAGINSILSPMLVFGMLIFYEKTFKIATDLRYLELSDFNHPLLRELASKAPGTFHHSMTMSTLSEQAAKEIDANQILARVGCYYHDIGKMIKPDYFVENQMESINKHEELNPSLSAKVIISHIKYGIQLAQKYKIPQEIIDFIPMHHGTTLVSYFFEKAKSEEMNSEEVHDYIYRYPGPKPHSRETAIVMLADAVEAATRSIDDPTPAKIETQIDEIIKSRFMEGEMDECELTLQDLIKIKHSFLKTIIGIHHHRIKYPESDDD